MKHPSIYLTILLLLLCSNVSHGQCPSDKYQIELSVSHGFITSDQLSDKIQADNNVSANSGGKTETYNSGANFVTLRYFMFNRLALEAAVGVSGIKGQYTDTYHPSVVTATYTENITTIAAEVYYIYFFRKYLEVYTILGAGPAIRNTTTYTDATSYAPASTSSVSGSVLKLQYSPVGVRFGGRLGGFAELGIGYKGIFNCGISFKLGPSCWWRAEGS